MRIVVVDVERQGQSRLSGVDGVELVQFVAGTSADTRLLARFGALFEGKDPAVRLTQFVDLMEAWEAKREG